MAQMQGVDAPDKQAPPGGRSPSLEALGRTLILLPYPVVVHRMGIVLWANNAAVTLAGAASLGDVVGLDQLSFVEPESRALGRERQAALFRDGRLEGTSEIVLRRFDGRTMVVEVMAALMDWEGEPAACAVLWDITDRRDQAERLRWESTHDELTKLLNRRGVLDQLDAWLAAPEASTGVGVIIADLDGFKEVNDTLGHDCGDRVLVEVGERLQHLARGHLVGRFGGDEFVVCVRSTCRAEVASLAEQMAGITVALRERENLVVVPSVGGVWRPPGPTSVDTLIAAADHAMYRAKRDHLGSVVDEAPT